MRYPNMYRTVLVRIGLVDDLLLAELRYSSSIAICCVAPVSPWPSMVSADVSTSIFEFDPKHPESPI